MLISQNHPWLIRFSLSFLKLKYRIAGIEAPTRDYNIPGTTAGKIFSTIGAAANLVFAFNTGMLPEIQVMIDLNCSICLYDCVFKINDDDFVTTGHCETTCG